MKRIHFNEVVTRDGFQIEGDFVPTDAKVQLVDALSAFLLLSAFGVIGKVIVG